MNILVHAIQAVQQNLSALGVYLAITVPAGILLHIANYLANQSPGANPYTNPKLIAYQVVASLFLAVTYAIASAIAFSRLGKSIDRPLWKISGGREALRRFFPMWLLLFIPLLCIDHLTAWASVPPVKHNLAGLAFLTMLVAHAVVIPIGACIMFHGSAERAHLREALRPLARQFPPSAVILFLGGMMFVFVILLIDATHTQRWLWPAIDIVSGYFDCLIFSGVWLICMMDRQMPEDNDFEF
ncbi:MAG: hypothetical protein GWP08_04435 [Nitrospiraceae bacterium]|nr:hypothetical protein [Nitrospiraceae bacterium]